MIRRLHFQGFKSLLDVELELGLLNVIVGANGSGKTNLLEALGLASAAVFGHVDDESLMRRGVRPGLPALYKTAFKATPIRRAITLEIADERALYRVVLDNPTKNPDSAWRFSNEAVELDGAPIATRSPRGARLHHRPSGPEKLEVDQLRGLTPLLRATSPAREVGELLDSIDWLSAFDASEGALYVTFLAVLALHGDAPAIAAVDNVDQALNPRLAKALIEAIQAVLLDDSRAHRPQLILTAHNPSVLDALQLADERVRLFVADRNNLGATVIRHIDFSEALADAKREGMTLSRLWLSGLLGGVPNL